MKVEFHNIRARLAALGTITPPSSKTDSLRRQKPPDVCPPNDLSTEPFGHECRARWVNEPPIEV
jgi:hypothetical protein